MRVTGIPKKMIFKIYPPNKYTFYNVTEYRDSHGKVLVDADVEEIEEIPSVEEYLTTNFNVIEILEKKELKKGILFTVIANTRNKLQIKKLYVVKQSNGYNVREVIE